MVPGWLEAVCGGGWAACQVYFIIHWSCVDPAFLLNFYISVSADHFPWACLFPQRTLPASCAGCVWLVASWGPGGQETLAFSTSSPFLFTDRPPAHSHYELSLGSYPFLGCPLLRTCLWRRPAICRPGEGGLFFATPVFLSSAVPPAAFRRAQLQISSLLEVLQQ